MGTEKRERQKANRAAKLEELRIAEQKQVKQEKARSWVALAAVLVGIILLVAFCQWRGNDDGGSSNTVTEDSLTDAGADADADEGEGEDAGADEGEDAEAEAEAEALEAQEAFEAEQAELAEAREAELAAAGVENTPVGDAVEPTCPEADGSSERTLDFTAGFENCLEDGVDYEAVFTTNKGVVKVDLDRENTPETTNNFVALSRYHYYDNTLVHRSSPGIGIIQGGSPHNNSAGDPGPGYNLTDEPEFEIDEETGGLIGTYNYEPGQLVMARTATPNGASAQYFFNVDDNASNLDASTGGPGSGTYVPFGTVTEGMDVLEDIMSANDGGEGFSELIVVESVVINPIGGAVETEPAEGEDEAADEAADEGDDEAGEGDDEVAEPAEPVAALDFDNIFFDVNAATIKAESQATLDEVAAFLTDNPDVSLNVEGHTDADGDDALNQNLSEERAASTVTALVERGIDASRLTSEGFGETQPLGGEKADDRRIEFRPVS